MLLLNKRITITTSEPTIVKPNRISGPHPITGEHWWGPKEDSHIDNKPKPLTIPQAKAALSIQYDIPEENIEIILKGWWKIKKN